MSTAIKAPAGQFTVLYFASAGSYTSKDSETFEAPLPLSKLFETLEGKYNGMKAKVLESCLVTVNLEYVDIPEGGKGDSEMVLKEGDEVAIIPPVSSG
jgi:molybdopterin synthase sulfur carrier subunit